MLRVTRRRKRAFVWKSSQNQCWNELLNAYQLAMTHRMDRNHTYKYQVSLCLYFETQINQCEPSFTLNLIVENA